jgi:hypothetical protein
MGAENRQALRAALERAGVSLGAGPQVRAAR